MKRSAIYYVPKGPLVLAVLNTKYHAWAFPGGKVEPGESPLAAVIRELHEETGAKASAIRQLYVGQGSADPEYEVTVFGGSITGTPYTREPGNVVAWVTPHHLTQSKAFGPFYQKFFAAIGLRP